MHFRAKARLLVGLGLHVKIFTNPNEFILNADSKLTVYITSQEFFLDACIHVCTAWILYVYTVNGIHSAVTLIGTCS